MFLFKEFGGKIILIKDELETIFIILFLGIYNQ